MSDTPLLAALVEQWGPAPAAARCFDACSAGGAGPRPDFFEASPQVAGDRIAPWRMTHYFDVGGRPLARRVEVFARFSACATALGVVIPEALAGLLAAPEPEPALRQLCLGIDARPEPEPSRLKLYAIFEGDAAAYTRALCAGLAVEPPAAASLGLTHIVGVDLIGARGLADVKLYYSMPPRRVPRTLRRPTLAIPLLRGCRRVVYQRSLIVPGKQSYHFHGESPAPLRAELARLREQAPATAELEGRLDALADAGLTPWILAHPFADGELERGVYSLYLHYGTGGAR